MKITDEQVPGRGYIGGGSIAGICGLSPFSSPLKEYWTITGELPRDEEEKLQRFFRRRKALEPFAARCFTLETGMEITLQNFRYQDPELSFAKAEIDFEVQPDGDIENGETKTVNPSVAWQWGNPNEGEAPPFYVTAQAMWGLSVTGRSKCWVHALVGLDDDRIYEVHRHEETIEKLRNRAARFWKYHIEPRRPPPPTTLEDINLLYQRDTGRQVEADTETQLALADRAECDRIIKVTENRREANEIQIKKFMMDATLLTVGGTHVASWKSRKDGVRVFRTR